MAQMARIIPIWAPYGNVTWATFFLAGYDATRTSMVFAALLLARNPDKQKKLLREIDEMISVDQELDFNLVSKLPYLHQVICETLRMYPPASR